MKKLWNSKLLYIILLVISSITFTASIVIRVAVPDMSSNGGFPGGQNQQFNGGDFDPSTIMGSDFDPSSMFGSDFDPANIPSGGSDVTQPSGSEFIIQPSGSEDSQSNSSGSPDPSGFSGEIPDGTMPDMSDSNGGQGGFPGGNGGFPGGNGTQGGSSDSGNGGFNPGQRGDNTTGGNNGTFLQSLRKNWLLMMIPSLLLMIFCIIRLIMISKKNKKDKDDRKKEQYKGMDQDEILKAQVKEEAELAVENRSKKKTKNIILACILVVVIIFVVVAGKLLTSETTTIKNTEVNEEVISANAETKDISTVIKGSGTVAFDDATDVTLPGSVTIAKWLVKNGDSVKAGDKLAELDTESVASEIQDLRSLIEDLDEELEDARTETVSSNITASAGGRVIFVYATVGTDVTDIMAESGALMVLSLDGTLSVTLPISELVTVGGEVTVVTSDETTYTGKVVAKDLTEMVVTVSDESTTVGDLVTVSTTDGEELGSGTLSIHSAQNITGFTGIVNAVNVSEGDSVKAGKVLMTLTNADYSKECDALLQKRIVLEEQLQTLITAYTTGCLYATADGVISGISDETTEVAKISILAAIARTNSGVIVASADVVSDTGFGLLTVHEGESEPSQSEPSQSEPSGDTPSGGDPSGDTPSGGDPSGNTPGGNNSGNNGNSGSQNFNGGGSSSWGNWGSNTSGQSTVIVVEETSEYELSDTTFCSITPEEKATIEIDIDERDISMISLDMDVTVSLDAYPGRSFSGQLTAIETEGTNDGGASKFAATVTMTPDVTVLSGMNASVIITKETKANLVTIPLNAVQESGTKVFVYTTYNEKTDELSDPVEIELGISDGENVEVRSGLSIGDKFFYRYAGTVTYNFLNRISR